MTTLGLDANLASLAPEEQAREHLTAVVPELLPFEAIEIRCLDTSQQPAHKGPRVFATSIDQAVEAAMAYCSDWDVFFGVGTRCCPDALTMADCPHQERGADHVARFGCVWGDFDAKTRSFDDVRKDLTALVLPPDLLVASGKGVHAYWLLTEPTVDQAAVEKLNRSFRLRLGADNAVDAARILRVAGTFNYKYGEPLPVRLLSVSHAV